MGEVPIDASAGETTPWSRRQSSERQKERIKFLVEMMILKTVLANLNGSSDDDSWSISVLVAVVRQCQIVRWSIGHYIASALAHLRTFPCFLGFREQQAMWPAKQVLPSVCRISFCVQIHIKPATGIRNRSLYEANWKMAYWSSIRPSP